MIPAHAAANLAQNGEVGEGEACVLAQMAKAIRANVEALELEMWRAETPIHVEGSRLH
jgi:hypothetical protein